MLLNAIKYGNVGTTERFEHSKESSAPEYISWKN